MRFHFGAGQGVAPDKWIVFRNRSRMSGENTGGDTDIEHLKRPAQFPPRHQQMAGFSRHEGYGPHRLERCAQRHAPPAAKTRRQIDGENRHGCLRHRIDHAPKLRRNLAGQSGTEHRVNHHVSSHGYIVAKRQGCDAANLESRAGIAFHGRDLAKMMNRNCRPALHKRACRNVTITAIIAASAEHDETQRVRIVAKGRSSDRLPCPLHKIV
ncbi:hypothetical protein D3C80_1379860 [compost metagenome]